MNKHKFNVGLISITLSLSLCAPAVAIAQDVTPQVSESTATPDAVAALKADPTAWLATARKINVLLSVQVRYLTLSDPSVIPTIVNLAKTSEALPKANIGAGLAQAALQFVKNNAPANATTIQQQIALAGDDALFRSFTAASNAIETASIGAPGPGTGGGVGSTGSGNAVPSTPTVTPPTPPVINPVATFSTSATVPTLPNFSTTTGASVSVSPTQ